MSNKKENAPTPTTAPAAAAPTAPSTHGAPAKKDGGHGAHGGGHGHGGHGSGQSAASTDKCRFELCKSKGTKFGFCQEHYEMYMAGVIRGDGVRPVDFEKKLEAYKASRKAA